MTVNELIEQLKNYPSDMRVLALGYEGGFDDINLKTDDIVFDVNNKDTWYFGMHERAGMCGNENETGEKCLIVIRAK